MKKRWICNDVWLNILPFFDRPQLGLELALISYRFDALVDKHFDGKSELTIWRQMAIRKDIGTKPKLSEWIDGKFVAFPLPDHPLPNKIRFKDLRIEYIDHSVITFLRSNKHIWDRKGINLDLEVSSGKTTDKIQQIWAVFARQIWPIFTMAKLHNLSVFAGCDHLVSLLRLTSPTILSDLNINSISFAAGDQCAADVLADHDDGPIAICAGQALAKWLHTPSKDGQPKRLLYPDYLCQPNLEWINNFKQTFLCATVSVSYTVQFVVLYASTQIVPFEWVNERTNEKLTLMKKKGRPSALIWWIMTRCPIIGQTKPKDENYLDANLNNVQFILWDGNDSIGPLSPPVEEKEEADQSNKNYKCN